MKVIELTQTNSDLGAAINGLRVVEKPIPDPGRGQVLVKIEAAPCNPSDLLFLQGKYGVKKGLPAVPGWEGAGTVVKSGGGLVGHFLKGRRVACGGQSQGDGTWAEYFIASAQNCIPIGKEIPSDQASTLIINPLTAIGMVEAATAHGHKAIIQTAACSQVGKMVQVLARQKGIPLINVVRRESQVNELQNSGEKWVLNSEEPNFSGQLKQIAHELSATIAFEAIGGPMTGIIFNAMPPKSHLLVYGALSEAPCSGISPLSYIFEQKKMEGFWLSTWLTSKGLLGTVRATRLVQSLMKSGDFETKIRARVGFNEWKEALNDYKSEMTAGKVILTPF